MFSFNKLLDSEWYFRKYISVISHIIPAQKVNEVKRIHTINLVYKSTFGKRLRLRHPKNLNEKLIWLSLYWRHPLKSICADKVKVRDFVADKGLSNLLVPIIGIYKTPEEIPYESLPDKFVLKCNHGCGYNIIVTEKSHLDQKSTNEMLSNWLSENYRGGVAELHYPDINPHLIICEEYLETFNEVSIIDYKLHCINGVPVFVLVCYNRDKDGVAKLASFDFEWNQLSYIIDEKEVNIPRPKSLQQMLEYARILSQPFPYVRVDFYDVAGKPVFGELTFTPYGNMITYHKPEILDFLGDKLKLPKKNK